MKVEKMEQIETFGMTENLIEQVAGFLEVNFLKGKKDISRLAIVFGGRRPALFLQRELCRKIKRPFFPPKFFTMDEFVRYVVSQKNPSPSLSALDACFMIYNLAREIAPSVIEGREHFAQFLPWAREIISFIEQLDLEDVPQESLRGIQGKAGIGYDVPDSINALLKSIIALRAAFHEKVREAKLYSRGLLYAQAAQCIEQIPFEEFDYILFCGFFYLHKTELRIVDHLYRSQKAMLFFQGSDAEWSVLADVAKVLRHPIRPEKPDKAAYNLSLMRAGDVIAETGLARETVKKIECLDKTVIVLPAPQNLVPLLSELAGHITDCNVSMGYPLNRTAVYALFECIVKSQETKRGRLYYTKDYLRVLSHPLVKNLTILDNASKMRILLHKVEEVLLGIEETPLGGSLFVALDEIEQSRQLYDLALDAMSGLDAVATREELKDALREIHQILFRNWERCQDLAGFSSALEVFLAMLMKASPLEKYPFNLKSIERIYALQENFERASFGAEPMPTEDIFKIFMDQLDQEMVPFSGSPLKGLQILGLLETRSLNFENCIIMDMNESVLPALKIYEPLIPREVMIQLGINRLEKEEEIQRYQFRRLISSSRNVYLMYQHTMDKEKSRFIEDILWERQKKGEFLNVPQACFSIRVFSERMDIEKDDAVVNFLKEKEYSSSSVNTYLACPLRFYYQYVLGLEEKAQLAEEPESADIGVFVHGLLEETFSGFVKKRPHIDASFRKYFFTTLEEKFKNEFEQKMKSDAFLIKEILLYKMQRFLENEKERDVASLLWLEQELKGKINCSAGTFAFQARIDRLDKLADGSLLIIDYKTGGADLLPDLPALGRRKTGITRRALLETIKSFQLPIYVYLAAQHKSCKGKMVNAALYSLKNITDAHDGLLRLFRSEDEMRHRFECMDAYKEALGVVMEEIVNPEVPFRADTFNIRYCKLCPFVCLCR
jgi:hypothetical protein